MTYVQTNPFQLFRHAWPAITAQAETRLLFDVHQGYRIRPLSAGGRSVAVSPQSARTDSHDPAHQFNGKCRSVFFDKLKPQGFWLAKNTVAFFRISLSSLRMRFSRRSRSFSWVRLKSSFDIMSVSRCAVIHLFSIDMPAPRSSATCFRVSPLVSAIRSASWRNSSVRFSPIVSLLCYSKCYQRSGIRL